MRILPNILAHHHHRWLGNFVLPLAGIAVLAWRAKRKSRPLGLTGALVGIGACLVTFGCVFAYSHFLWLPKPHAWFDPTTIFILWSALPTALPFNLLFGKHKFVEDHFLIPFAMLSWTLAGAIIGAVATKIRNRLARP